MKFLLDGDKICEDDCNGDVLSSKGNDLSHCDDSRRSHSSAVLLVFLVIIVCLCPCCFYCVVAGLYRMGYVLTWKGIRRRSNFVPLALASRVAPNPNGSVPTAIVVSQVAFIDSSDLEIELSGPGDAVMCAHVVQLD